MWKKQKKEGRWIGRDEERKAERRRRKEGKRDRVKEGS